MICPKCSQYNMDGIIVCPYCGASLKAEDSYSEPKTQGTDADNHFRSDAMPLAEREDANSFSQYLSEESTNKKSGINKWFFAVGVIVLLMAVFFGIVIIGFVGRANQNIDAKYGAVNEKKDSIESKHEDILKRVSSESYVEDSTDREMKNLSEQNLQEESLLGQNISEQELVEQNPPETVGTEVIKVYGGIKAPAGDFIFPYSSQRFLTDQELSTLKLDDAQAMHDKSQMAINEIFARYGYTFGTTTKTSSAAKERFEVLDWYIRVQKKCPSDSWWTLQSEYFNEYEVQNVQTLNEWQKQHGVYY